MYFISENKSIVADVSYHDKENNKIIKYKNKYAVEVSHNNKYKDHPKGKLVKNLGDKK